MDRNLALDEIIKEQLSDLNRFTPDFLMDFKRAFGMKPEAKKVG